MVFALMMARASILRPKATPNCSHLDAFGWRLFSKVKNTGFFSTQLSILTHTSETHSSLAECFREPKWVARAGVGEVVFKFSRFHSRGGVCVCGWLSGLGIPLRLRVYPVVYCTYETYKNETLLPTSEMDGKKEKKKKKKKENKRRLVLKQGTISIQCTHLQVVLE